jgi:hypothetical protein
MHVRSTGTKLPLDLLRQEVVVHSAQRLTNYVQVVEEVTEVPEIIHPLFWVKRSIRIKWTPRITDQENMDACS